MSGEGFVPALPQAFLRSMEALLGEEYPAFLASFDAEKTYGLRHNPLKLDRASFLQLAGQAGWVTGQVPWAAEGFYADPAARPGRHPLHEAGLYYIQEPSAMAVAEFLLPADEPRQNLNVLDLCAAPGGKTTQLAGRMGPGGLLVANEIMGERARILSRNVERMGVRNAVVTSEAPARLAQRFPGFFDRILADAPCSGEGMFRKDPAARQEWSPENVQLCVNRQRQVLEAAALLLAPGGVLVYSTCTFNRSENEDQVAAFLADHPDFACEAQQRIWPHRQRGEGHFMARLVRRLASAGGTADSGSEKESSGKERSGRKKKRQAGTSGPEGLADWQAFAAGALQPGTAERLSAGMRPQRFGEQLCLLPEAAPWLDGLKVLRPGLCLGSCKKGRLEPDHALALALHPEDALRVRELAEDECLPYLTGQTLPCDASWSGWCLVSFCGCSLGWGKADRGILKNHYPRGLRIQL